MEKRLCNVTSNYGGASQAREVDQLSKTFSVTKKTLLPNALHLLVFVFEFNKDLLL